MAGKNAKRKVFDIPVLDDIDEVVPVTPVFARRTKTRNPQKSKTSTSISENSKSVPELATKSSDRNERFPAPCRAQSDTGEAKTADIETIQITTGEASQSNKSKSLEKISGKNVLEFENTKCYEAGETQNTKASSSKDISETA